MSDSYMFYIVVSFVSQKKTKFVDLWFYMKIPRE